MVKLYWHFRTLLAVLLAATVFVIFAVTNPAFTNSGNLYALLQSLSILSLVAVGLALVMIAGEFDLSIAGVFPLSALIAVSLGERFGIAVGLCLAILTCFLVGLVNGWMTARLPVSSLAVTVGTLVLTIGLGFALAGGDIVTMQNFSAGLWLDQTVVGAVLAPRTIIQLLLVVAAILLMAKTWQGIQIYSVGSDAERSASSGLPVSRALILVFIISAVFAGVSGSLQGLSLASGAPGVDEATLLQAVAAAIIGGVALTGGKGNIVGVVAGATLLATVSNGLSLQGTSTAVVQLVNGGILLLIVILDRPLNRAVRRALERASRKPETGQPISLGGKPQ